MPQKLIESILKTSINNVELVQGGTTPAKNYRFNTQNKEWLLRIFNPEHTLAERRQEANISYLVGEYGISGKVIFSNDECLIREYLSGKPLTYSNLHDRSILKKIISLLKIQHQIPIKNLSLATLCEDRIKHHLALAKVPHLLEQLAINVNYTEITHNPVLIHNDLHHANILLHKDKLHFIDWSLAGVGNIFSDLAEIAIYLDHDLRRYILTCYFNNDEYFDELEQACHARLLLFAAWALNMAQEPIQMKMLSSSQLSFEEWIYAITHKNLTLTGAKNFIDFAASCLLAAMKYQKTK